MIIFLRRKITTFSLSSNPFHKTLPPAPRQRIAESQLHILQDLAEGVGKAGTALIHRMSPYFVPKPVCNVANENALVREMRLSSVGKQNLWVGISDFQQ